jgi:hypothetical protein
MNTCGSCKHFGEPYEHEIYEGKGDVEKTIVTKYHFCMLLQHLNGYGDDSPKVQRPAGVIDGSGYSATMCVTEEFGCNQWSAREVRGTVWEEWSLRMAKKKPDCGITVGGEQLTPADTEGKQT